MSSSNRAIVAILLVAALAIAFWMLLLGPKREEVGKLDKQVESLSVALAEAQSHAAEAVEAKRKFPADYRQLVVLGQAVPAGDETSSLIVELDKVAEGTKIGFESIRLTSSGGEAEATEAPPAAPPAEAPAPESSGAVPAASTVPPTELSASLMPLGATIGPAGLAVMPYDLTFKGNFFEVADFIKEIDSLVHTGDSQVSVDGRLITIDGFSLSPETTEGEETTLTLNASFSVTTFVVPPGEGVTAGASPTAPAPETPAPASESGESGETSETVAAQ
jgi:Tfp pilus assembly protein PilO